MPNPVIVARLQNGETLHAIDTVDVAREVAALEVCMSCDGKDLKRQVAQLIALEAFWTKLQGNMSPGLAQLVAHGADLYAFAVRNTDTAVSA